MRELLGGATLVDTHCHLTIYDDDQLAAVLDSAAQFGVTRFICVGASDLLNSAERAIHLAERFDNIWATVGVHPHDADKVDSYEPLFEMAQHPKVCAIGETGLDYFKNWSPKEKQLELFRFSIELARNVKKPLVIHCRDASEDVIKELQRHGADEVGGVFHCFSEDASCAERLAKLNFLVSFTGNITFKKANSLREAVKSIPLTQIMVETDCPYMTPEPFRGQPSEPKHVFYTAEKIAQVKGLSLAEVAAQTTATACRFFNLD